ncbi:MAG: hypothetical protein ACYDER_27170, partial [Ktedonobacteraceae bacterium]
MLGVVLLSVPDGRPVSARAVPAPSPHCGGWSIVPSPNPTEYQNELYAVAAVSTSDVWAVGDSQTIHGPGVALIEHWDGTSWQVVASPVVDGILLSIAAVSATDVWAVGADVTGPLIDHWDGSIWQVVASPSVVEGILSGISAQSATDIWAVGGQAGDKTLTEHWDGTSWQVVASANVPDNTSLLNSVSAVSASDVWAVGSHTGHGGHALPYTLIEHWDGQHWQIVSSPNVGGFSPLNGVAALSSQDVWAVGQLGDSTLNEHWDGSRWSVVSPTLNGVTYSVVALTPTDIWAVGDAYVNFTDDTFVEQWDSTRWQQVASPSVTATTISASYYNYLNGVSASSAHNIWAVGYVAAYSNEYTYTLIEAYC